MMLVPCAAVHTAFMRFPIDVVVIDRHGFAVKIVEGRAAVERRGCGARARRDRDGGREP
jgi:hypothetical protein